MTMAVTESGATVAAAAYRDDYRRVACCPWLGPPRAALRCDVPGRGMSPRLCRLVGLWGGVCGCRRRVLMVLARVMMAVTMLTVVDVVADHSRVKRMYWLAEPP